MSEYNLRSTVPICGMYDGNKPIVEIGVIQTVPEGQVILSDTPKSEEEYERKARVGLSISEAREVAFALNEMADKMEKTNE